jgi:hypothetical protein
MFFFHVPCLAQVCTVAREPRCAKPGGGGVPQPGGHGDAGRPQPSPPSRQHPAACSTREDQGARHLQDVSIFIHTQLSILINIFQVPMPARHPPYPKVQAFYNV